MATNPTVTKYFRRVLYMALALIGLFFITSFTYALYLRWFPPFTTHLMVLRGLEGSTDEDWKLNCKWKAYDEISDYAKIAVIASEDQNFASHIGLDFNAIEKAYKANKRSKKQRGGSTISQQVAKNVFLWPSRTWLRKGLEVYFTLLIETIWPKQRILQMYLNIAEMGDGVFGIEAASRKYYRKDAGYLTQSEAAMIAAVLPNPRKYKVNAPSAYVKKRQTRILRFMRAIGGKDYLKLMQ